MSYSDFIENSILDYIFGKTSFIPSGTIYVTLSSGTPGENGLTLLEPTAAGYARVAVTNDKTYWSGAINAVSSGTIHNVTNIEFPRASALWGLVSHFAVMDQSSGGHMYGYGTLSSSRTIYSGDTPNFASGTLTITMD